ncbi:MAG TPA: ATP-binding protein [Coleofasciculaceae cyanobacterium]
MSITVNPNWYQANYQYLMTSIDRICQVLEGYIARKKNQPISAEPDLESALIAAANNLPTPSALDKLCSTFSLSPFERDILLLCVGMELDPNFEFLLANAQSNSKRAYPTFGLALAVLPNPNSLVLAPQTPLQHWQLIEIGEGQALTQCPLRIDKRILSYLLGNPCVDEKLLSIIEPLPLNAYGTTALQPSHQTIADELVALWSTVDTSTPPILQLCGDEIAAKHTIATAACLRLGCNLSVLEASHLPSSPQEINYLLQRWEREALLSNSTLLLDCDEVNSMDAVRASAISQLIKGINTRLIISSRSRQHPSQRAVISFDVPKLTHSEQMEVWQQTLGAAAAELNGQVEALVSQFNLSTPAIQAACTGAMGRLTLQKGQVVSINSAEEKEADNGHLPTANQSLSLGTALWDICRIQSRPRLDDLAQRINSTATWDDLVLPEQQRQILRDITAHVRQRAKVYEGWGFASKGGRGLGISALFSGASGTGKTMAAEVMANELKLDLYRIDLSAVVSKYIGETEKNLRRIFDAAEAGGAILLFDEADALFGKRTEVKDSHDRHANVEVSYLLQRMEAYQGLAILTTNLKESLDKAFLRRIRFVIKFPFPDATQRAEIWRRIFPNQTPTKALDANKLGKLNVAGGNIRNIALNAAFLAADAGEPVMMKHILTAAKSEYIKLEQPLADTEVRGWV